jgi:CO/xanthine dehydrogenase Mo-binding subunit
MTTIGAARYAGNRVHRVEDARLLTGAGTFVDDITRPGMLHACFVRSPHARARIVAVDASAALELPGVHAVFTAADLNPDVREAWYTGTGKIVPDTPRPPLAAGEARFAGDPVALVVADSRYIAEDAAELVDVDYEPLPAVADYATAGTSQARVHEAYQGNLAGELGGAPWETLADVYDGAPHVVSETIWQQAYTAVPIETRGLVVEWSRGSGELTIWAATQAPHEVRMFAARLLGVPEHLVRVITRDVGGGFGQKVMPLREDICLLLAARKVPVAIKWVEDRRENLQAAGQARHEHGTAELAFDAEGGIIAATLDHVQDVGAYPTPWPVGTGAAVGMIFPGPYRVTKGTFTHASMFSNTPGRIAYRGQSGGGRALASRGDDHPAAAHPGDDRWPYRGGRAVKPASFEYHAPSSVKEAVDLLADLGDSAKVIAGGQSLVPVLAMRLAVFDHLIDIRRIDGLRGIEERDGAVWIGAATTEAEIGRSELIAARVPLLSHLRRASRWRRSHHRGGHRRPRRRALPGAGRVP